IEETLSKFGGDNPGSTDGGVTNDSDFHVLTLLQLPAPRFLSRRNLSRNPFLRIGPNVLILQSKSPASGSTKGFVPKSVEKGFSNQVKIGD
ncbi:MAG: hypothetical protein KC978_24965, partial [Candidatus Omnitrophica bacterium]|nr:hypothetical protein [Candidatus Omnitrophota bacterium]